MESRHPLKQLIAADTPLVLYIRPYEAERNERVVNFAPYTEAVEEEQREEEYESNMARRLLLQLHGQIVLVGFVNLVAGTAASCDVLTIIGVTVPR